MTAPAAPRDPLGWLAVALAVVVLAVLVGRCRGADAVPLPTTQPATRPAAKVRLDDVEVVLLTRAAARAAVWGLPAACEGKHRPFVIVVAAATIYGGGECGECATLYTDKYGPMSDCTAREWAEWAYPGRDVVLVLVRAEEDEEGPPPAWNWAGWVPAPWHR